MSVRDTSPPVLHFTVNSNIWHPKLFFYYLIIYYLFIGKEMVQFQEQ